MKRENELLFNMCLFVDKIFQIRRSMGGNGLKSLSGEIVDNYYPRKERLSDGCDEYYCTVGPHECSVIIYT